MRTRMTNNVRKQALHALKPQRSKAESCPVGVTNTREVVRKKSRKSNKRAKKNGRIAKYKELHAVGRRSSSQFVTYSQDGRLFYDLYARYTPYATSIKAANATPSASTPDMGSTHSSSKRQPLSSISSRTSLTKVVPTKTRSASRRRSAITKEENGISLSRDISQRRDKKADTRGRFVRAIPAKHSKQNSRSKKESAKIRLQRKLKRELGVDVIPKIQAVSKRLASINAVAIINAVTRDGSKRLVTTVKSTATPRRDSTDTMPCVESKVERAQEDASVHSDDALTEPMSQSPSALAGSKSVLVASTSPPTPVLCTSLPFISKNKIIQTPRKTRKSCPTLTPVISEHQTSPPENTPSTSTPCQELVSTRPQTSTMESYHTEQLIPLGPSGFGFQQITTQVIRYAQPDCSMLVNTRPVAAQVSQPISAANPTTVPVTIRPPGDLCQSVHAPNLFNNNRAHTLLSNIALPMLTPMPTLNTWPTLLHPYTHVAQPLHAQLPQPNSTVFIPSFIPIPTQFHCSLVPSVFHPQLDRPPTLLPPPAAPLPPPPPAPPTLVPSPMCNLPTVQPTMAPPFSIVRSVPPTLYCTVSPPPFPLRDSTVPLHTPVHAITAHTASSLGLQLPVCNQPVFASSTPHTVSISLPPLSQDTNLVPTSTLIPSHCPLNAFNLSTLTVPSPTTLSQIDGHVRQPDPPKTSVETNTGSSVSVTLLHPADSHGTSTSVPMASVINDSVLNSDTSALIAPSSPALSSSKFEQNTMTTNSLLCIPPTTLPSPETTSLVQNQSSLEPPKVAPEPVVLCPVDGSQNAWQWEGNSYTKAVFCRSDGLPVVRTCYPAIRHRRDGMVIQERDCVLLCSGPDRSNPPHVAKITALFEDSTNSETKMMSLLWYYRPEHVGCSRGNLVPNELYASRHCDTNPVDCIEDKAYVLTASAFARYMARLKYRQTSYPRPPLHRVVPPRPRTSPFTLESVTGEGKNPAEHKPTEQTIESDEVPDSVNPANVFLCRENSNKQTTHHVPSKPCSPKQTTADFADPPILDQVELIEPEKTPQVAQASSTEPSPANSPSLCICLPDSPSLSNQTADVDPSTHSQKCPDGAENSVSPTAPCTSPVITLNNAISPDRNMVSSGNSSVNDRASTPLKAREPAPVSESSVCSPPKLPHCTDISYVYRQPSLTGHTSNMDLLGSHATTVASSMLLQPISCTVSQINPAWIPPNSMMPLLESSILETSADLSVNWAEHGEQIALSLDCRNAKPLGMIPAVPHPSNNVTDSLGQIHPSLPNAASTMTWSSPLVDRPVATTDLFGHTQLPILCPGAAATASTSTVANSHESETPRLVIL
ncbi:Bromo adjacent domain-containing 1 protein [Fasciolopsis buskii]|uniref:Bromo adjacent domain-containing 1 protein n=1 Tax=Fasciolopsis buskii TaxID=27845 RepID=A0A8E0RYG1_9TREM|nr:Bromo adjacent domain-containing 1 protein [Fasciolopsis buski]